MLYLLIVCTVWLAVAIGLFVYEAVYYAKNPYMWNRRFEGMISLSDKQRWGCYVLWPLVIVGLIAFGIFLLVCLALEHIQDYRRKAR